jgi:putative transposase
MPLSIAPDDTLPDAKWLMPDEVWQRIHPLLPPAPQKGKRTQGGRPNVDLRRTMNAIFYVLRTGCQWKAIPRCLGSGSTAHDYFQKWTEAGVFEKFWRASLEEYDALQGIQWQWQAMDGTMTKAPLAARRLARTRRTGPSRERNASC